MGQFTQEFNDREQERFRRSIRRQHFVRRDRRDYEDDAEARAHDASAAFRRWEAEHREEA